MSMNLCCNKFDLVQTPTYITYMCLMQSDGPAVSLTSLDAKRAIQIYCTWLESLGEQAFNRDNNYREYMEDLRNKANEIREELKTVKNLKVWYE